MDQLKQALESISESVRIDSSRGTPEQGMPFGRGAYDCLNHFLSLAQAMGFQTNNYDNYIGEVLFGEGEPFAVLAHLDVVPAGSGWTKEPFGGTVEDGKLWGRGAVDDKGPAICTLYALKALKDKGFCPRKQIRLIVGCNEEDGWACIEHYRQCAQLPETGFSPDADFPVIYAEKGILHVLLRFPVPNAPFSSFEGGAGANMVCADCSARVPAVDLKRAAEYALAVENNTLRAKGKSAHGSTPEQGVNAMLPLLEYFKPASPAIGRVLDCVFYDVYGLKKLQDETGRLTLSPNLVSYREGTLNVLCDIRYPATLEAQTVYALIDRFGVPYETVHRQTPLMQDKEGRLVQTLLSVYEAHTGRKAEPVAIGGGTYARALQCGVAFGPEIEGDEPVVHQADEYISVERVKLLLEIYEDAIRRLTQ